MQFYITDPVTEKSDSPLTQGYRCRASDIYGDRYEDAETPEKALFKFVDKYGMMNMDSALEAIDDAAKVKERALDLVRVILQKYDAENEIREAHARADAGYLETRKGCKIRVRGDDTYGWEADRPELTGSPPVGHGKTWRAALLLLILSDPRAFSINDNIEIVDRLNNKVDTGNWREELYHREQL